MQYEIREDLVIFSIIAAVAATVIVVICLIAFRMKISHAKKTMQRKVNNYAHVIELSKNNVISFERRNTASIVRTSLKEFIDFFHSKDQRRVLEWFESIKKDPTNCEKNIEVESSTSYRKTSFILLSLRSYKPEINTIYIEGTKLNNLYSSEGRKKFNNNRYLSIKKNQIENVFKGLKSKKGYAFLINFFYNKREIIGNGEIDKKLLLKLKNEITPFIKAKRHFRYFVSDSDSELFMYDFKMRMEESAIELAKDMSLALRTLLNSDIYANVCGFSIGIVSCSSFAMDEFVDLNEDLQKAASIARDNGVDYYLFEKTRGFKDEHKADNSVISKLFANRSLKYLFRPIYNIEENSILGYFSYVKPYDGSFNNYIEMAQYANKVDRNRELLGKTSNIIVSKFYSECPKHSQKLFLEVSLVDIEHLSAVLNNIPSSEDVNIVLMFYEGEINANSFSQDLLITQLSELKGLGFEIALSMKDEDMLLEPSVYSNFDYFVVGSSMVSKVRVSNRIRISNKFLIEQLLQYQRPIITTDLEGWPSIELFVRSGCMVISSNDLSPMSEMILPIDKKKIQKIKNLLK